MEVKKGKEAKPVYPQYLSDTQETFNENVSWGIQREKW